MYKNCKKLQLNIKIYNERHKLRSKIAIALCPLSRRIINVLQVRNLLLISIF